MDKRFVGSIVLAAIATSSICFAVGSDHPGKIADDSALVAAFESHKRVDYVEAGNLTVSQILPDDTKGLTHQKWQATLSDGNTVTIIYNTDLGNRVPVKIGDHFGVGGQYIPTGHEGIIHWLHDDPKHMRPDGYVYLNGFVYGDGDHEDNNKN